MDLRSNGRYGALAQTLHWTTAVLVVMAFAYGLGGPEERVYSVARDAQRQIHETLGALVLVLTVLRVLWRAIDRSPEPEDMPRWMQLAAKCVQGFLYLLLFAVPLTAMVGAWMEGHALTFLGNKSIPPMLALSHETGAMFAKLHTVLGNTILWLAGLHAFAAIYHHLKLKDRVLLTMLPAWIASRSKHNESSVASGERISR